MLHMIHETMNMNYVTWTKLICKMNIDRMYMKMTSKYMTYLYKYYVPGTATITITMQCTNTLPRSNEKLPTADLNKSLDNNEEFNRFMPNVVQQLQSWPMGCYMQYGA